jgi:hypothetical protein
MPVALRDDCELTSGESSRVAFTVFENRQVRVSAQDQEKLITMGVELPWWPSSEGRHPSCTPVEGEVGNRTVRLDPNGCEIDSHHRSDCLWIEVIHEHSGLPIPVAAVMLTQLIDPLTMSFERFISPMHASQITRSVISRTALAHDQERGQFAVAAI